MKNPLTQKQMGRLSDGVDFSRQELKNFRQRRKYALEQVVGYHYGDRAAEVESTRIPFNHIAKIFSILQIFLASKNPQVLVRSDHVELKPDAYKLELAVNKLVEDLKLNHTMRRLIQEAIIGFGVLKVGLHNGGSVEIDGERKVVGRPYADVISMDDWVHDMQVERFENIDFAGNQYVLDLEDAKQSGLYDESVINEIEKSDLSLINTEGDERALTLSIGTGTPPDKYRSKIRVYDLWLPKEGVILTMNAVGGSSGAVLNPNQKPLRVVEWDGPESGPYKYLNFDEVPDNTMPLPPVANMMDLHNACNNVLRKAIRQAERQKTVATARLQDEKDAKRMTQAGDGAFIRAEHPDQIKQLAFGGPDQGILFLFLQMKELLNDVSGNLDAVAGLGPQSKTVGQDELIDKNASQKLTAMQNTVYDVAKEVIKDLAYYLYNDPLIDLPLVKRVPGTEVEIPVRWTPEDAMRNDFLEWNFDIVPYSMQEQTPASRLQAITGVFNQFVGPYAELMAQSGLTINFSKLMKLVAKYTGVPEIEDILVFQGSPPMHESGGPIGQSPSKSSHTVREYHRKNIPAASQAGNDRTMAQMMMNMNPQNSEVAGLFRKTG